MKVQYVVLSLFIYGSNGMVYSMEKGISSEQLCELITLQKQQLDLQERRLSWDVAKEICKNYKTASPASIEATQKVFDYETANLKEYADRKKKKQQLAEKAKASGPLCSKCKDKERKKDK